MLSQNQIEHYKEKFKHLDPRDYFLANLLDSAKNSGYVCPFCGNGTGEDGTGVDFQLVNDGYKGYCFKCGKNFDVFDLVAEKYHLSVRTQFIDVLNKAIELFGDDFQKPVQIATPKPAEPTNFAKLIRESWDNLDLFYRDRINWRGLTKATLTTFGCGYLPKWHFGFTFTPRIIIPTSDFHFLARFVGDSPCDQKSLKIHRGKKEIFGSNKALKILEENSNHPIFAVEGEVDVMSIFQCGFTAISFSGSDISAHQQELLKKFPSGTAFILMLDNDETGKLKTPKCKKILQELGFKVYETFLDGDGDFNDHFIKNPDELKSTLQKIFDDALNYFSKEIPKKIEVEQNFEEKIKCETQIQIPSCPINLIVPKNFTFQPSGIYHEYKDKKGKTVTVLDTATPIVPTRIFQRADRSGRTLELAYFERAKNLWHKITVPATTIAKTSNITDLSEFGVDVNSTRARALSDFLMWILNTADNSKKIPQVQILEQTGWADDNCENFIYPPEGTVGGEAFAIQDNGFEYAEKFTTNGDKDEWCAFFEEAYSGKNFAWVRYALGLVLAAPLVRLCHSRNWQGVLVAPSGSAKSAVAELAMSIFGNPDKLHATFNSTNNFADELSPRLNDLPCWVDEFQTADENTRKKFSNFIYNYAEGKTRGRLSKNSEMKKQYEFHGTRLCTSEETVLQDNFSQGAFNRVFQIKNFQPLDDDFAVTLHERLVHTHGHFGKDFIDYVRAHKSDVQKTYADVQEKYRSDDFIPHHVQQIALVYTALEFFYRMLKERGELVRDDFTPLEYLADFDIHFFRELLPTPQESNNILRGRKFLAEILISHSRFFGTKGAGSEADVEALAAPALGYIYTNGNVAFFPKAIDDFLKDNHYPGGAKDLMDGLKRDGLLELPKSGKGLKKGERFGNKGVLWVYFVKKEAFTFEE